jgi:hypothetical protein
MEKPDDHRHNLVIFFEVACRWQVLPHVGPIVSLSVLFYLLPQQQTTNYKNTKWTVGKTGHVHMLEAHVVTMVNGVSTDVVWPESIAEPSTTVGMTVAVHRRGTIPLRIV